MQPTVEFLLASGDSSTLFTLTMVVVLAIGAQWIAWRLRIPSILLLLTVGFVAGVTGYLNPDDLIGDDLLLPLVSLSVALILFEGGLTLELSELHESSAVIRNLCTIGALVTMVLTTFAAYLLLDVGFAVALVLGSLLVVTGPTVVGPLLRHIRPAGRVGAIAKWEGIVIDPVGATLAVLALACIEAVELGTGSLGMAVFGGLFRTIFWGGLIGLLGAWPTIQLMRRYWIPDHLEIPVLLMLVVGCFTLANHLQRESGLFAVTLMGVIFANQKSVPLKHVVEFKENLRILLISLLFIVLAARIDLETLRRLGWSSVAFVAALMLVVRPACVFVSTLRSGLSWQERVFLAWLAPRGIVAAALASVFALELQRLQKELSDAGQPFVWIVADAGEELIPVTFLVIVVTVAVYGLTAAPFARWLGISIANPQGVLFASAHPGARAIASSLQEAGFGVLLVDSNLYNVQVGRMEGLPTVYASILSEHVLQELDLGGIGRFVAMTRNDEVNALAALHFSEIFGRAEVYHLAPTTAGSTRTDTAGEILRGRRLFSDEATYEYLDERFARGASVKRTKLTDEFNYEAFRALYGETALVMFVISDSLLSVNTTDQSLVPKPGETVVALVDATEAASEA